MARDEMVRARIGEELKQEFQDICPNMSETLVFWIKDYVTGQKEKYSNGIVSYFKMNENDIENLDVLAEIIEKIYIVIKDDGVRTPQELVNKIKDELKERHKEVDELIVLIYRDLLRGLYAGKDKDNIQASSEKLYRNKYRIVSFIQNKLYGE